ncbi:MAG: quinate 5-dehydrogenase [Candidatus Eremiobacteraeota bacterium]|nr:quinate 5-dehydrogenase [Candidatus Eremiobacteraeota bacterium]
MRKVVSVSLGSKKRDHEVRIEFLGEEFLISRRGTDGDISLAIQLLKELDGKVDAIGLGGVDIYIYSPGHRYVLKDGMRLKESVRQTPVVDGSGLKNTLEHNVIRQMASDSRFNLKGKKALMVCAMDRFGMAEALAEAGCRTLFGDFIFALGIEKPLFSLDDLEYYAEKLIPIIANMPIDMLYPTGSVQEKEPAEKYARYYREADIVAGDFHLIRKFMPRDLSGMIVITNTVTPADIKDLAERDAMYLVTTTPEFGGRSFGTNVLEAVLVSLLGKAPDDIIPEDYNNLINKLGLKPRIEELNPLLGEVDTGKMKVPVK